MNINLQQAKSLLKNNKVIAYIKQDGVPVYTDVHKFVPFNDVAFKSICIDLLNDNNVQLTHSDNILFEELQAINNNDLLDHVILSDDWEDVTSLKDLKFFTGFTTIKNLSNNNEIFKNIVEIDMRNISTIGSYTFLNHAGISLYNTYNITSINQHAFDSAIILNDTLAFNSLTTLGQYAFYNAQFNNIIHLGVVTSIPQHCFENSVFTNITFTGNNISIGNYCFKRATIGHFTQESHIISIGNNAFENIESEIFVQLSDLLTLGNNAFKGSNISTIISLGNIAAIEEYAFSDCVNLTNLDFIPNTVQSIGSHAFDGCINIKKIQFPSSVTSIDSYAISNCTKLRSIKSFGSITAFTSLMVNNCPNLEIVYFPDTIESWNAIAFNNCTNLKIFANIKNYSNLDRCFANCPKLDTIWFADTLAEIKVNGIQVCNNQFIKTIKLGKYLDPSTRNNITDFEIVEETITVDNEEQTISHYPFEQMTLLTTVDANNTSFDIYHSENYMSKFNTVLSHIPNNIKLLHISCKHSSPVTAENVETVSFSSAINDQDSFLYSSGLNNNLHNIIFEDNENVQYMQNFSYTFADDTSLNLKIGKHVSDIRYGSWYKNDGAFAKLNIDFSTADNLKNIQYSGLTFNGITDKVYINMPVLPSNLEQCNYSAFCGNSTENRIELSNDLVFPNTIKEINYESFKGIDFNNHTLTIPPTAEVSIYSAFCVIKNLKKLNICNVPNHKVKQIYYSFQSIGDSSGNIHFDDFYITKDLKLSSSFNTADTNNNNTFTIDNLIFDHDYIYDAQSYNSIFNQMPTVTNLYLPDDSRCYKTINCKPINIHNLDGSIHNDAVSRTPLDLQLLKSIEYKNNTTHVNGIYYYGSLPALESINIPDTVEYIGNNCFQNTPLLKSFDMPDNIQYIGMNAFYNSGIKNINLKNAKWIGYRSFMNCNNLKEVEIPASIVNYPNISDLNYDNRYGFISGPPYNGAEAFSNCQMLKRVILPNNMTTLPYGIFKDCIRLSDINLDNIRILQKESLRNTSVNIDLENTQLTTIGEYALYSATNVFKETLTLSDTITEIGDGGLSTSYNAINGRKIKTIVLPQNLHKLSKEVFENHQYLNTINLENINYFDVLCLANTNISKLGSNINYECDLSDTSIKYIGKSFIKNTPLYKNLVKFDISNTKCSDVSLYTLNDICNYPYSIDSTNTYAVEIDLSNSNVNRLDTDAFVFKLNTGSSYSKKVKLNWKNQEDYINLGTRSICNTYDNTTDNLIVDIDILNSSLGDVSLNNSENQCNTKVNFINLPLGEVVYINPSTGFYVTYPDSAVMDNGTYGIETLKFGPSVNNSTYFSTNIFSCCKKLDLSESKITHIDAYKFSGSNNKFEEITIGNNVTYIGTAAFESCPYLKKVDIGTGITSIGFYAFVNNPVEVLICRATTPPILANGHNNYRLGLYDTNLSKAGAGIYVPDESVEAYKQAWSSCSIYDPNSTYTADHFIKPLSELPDELYGNDYVQSGLVLHLDGINKGSENSWIDSVSNRKFVERGNVTKDSSSYILNGSESYTTYLQYNISNFPEFEIDNSTVEVCYKLAADADAYYIFGSGIRHSFNPLIYVNTTNITWNEDGHTYYNYCENSDSVLFHHENPITLSINGNRGIINGEVKGEISQETTDYWDENGDGRFRIGAATRGTAARNPFNGHIYSIRFYNRKLTQAEQLHNQQVDNTRFNLGLTIGE